MFLMIVKHMQYANLFPPFFVWIPSFYDNVFVVQSVCFCEVFLHSLSEFSVNIRSFLGSSVFCPW